MNQKQVNALIKQYQTGNKADKLMASNMLWMLYHEWVEKIVGANAKVGFKENKEEMLSEACVGFMNGLEKYDLEKAEECSLKTYSAFWIRGALINYKKRKIHDGYTIPRCSSALRSRLYAESKDRNSISNESLKAISIDYNIPEQAVRELEIFYCQSENISFDGLDPNDDLYQVLSSDPTLGSIDKNKVLSLIRSFVNKQNEPISLVLNSRWLADKKVPLKKLGIMLDQSYESIRQIEITSFNSLMSEMKDLAVI